MTDLKKTNFNVHPIESQQTHVPKLEHDLPVFNDRYAQRLNKKGVAFIIALLLLAAVGSAWAFKRYFKQNQASNAVVLEKIVTAPDVPINRPLPAAPLVVAEPPVVPVLAPSAPVIPQIVEKTEPVRTSNVLPVIVPPNSSDPLFEQRRSSTLLLGSAEAPSGNKYFTDEFADVKRGGVQKLANRDKLLVRNTYIRCVLETKIVSEVKGFTSCVVTEPIYSANGKTLLIPKGSRVSGEYQNTDVQTARVGVIWSRITTPTGLDVRIDSPGVDEMGSAGHKGDYKSNWASRFAGSMMVSMLSDAFKVAANVYGPKTLVTTDNTQTENPFQSNTADTLQRTAEQALAKTINKPATVTINQGALINIYTSRDIDFSSVLN